MGAKTQSGKAGIFSVKALQTIGLGTAWAVIALAIWLMGWDSLWEAKTWDWRVRLLAKNGKATQEICLILPDQNSLDWGKNENSWSWPWLREVYFCKRSGVKSIQTLVKSLDSYSEKCDMKNQVFFRAYV